MRDSQQILSNAGLVFLPPIFSTGVEVAQVLIHVTSVSHFLS